MHCSNRLAPVGKDAVKCRSCGVRLMLALIFALLLVSCGNKLTSGEVYEKSFTEAHIEIVMVPFVHSDGKTSYTTMTPMYYRYPDTWEIAIKAWDPEKERWQKQSYYVTEDIYKAVNIGDEFQYSKENCWEDERYTREKAS